MIIARHNELGETVDCMNIPDGQKIPSGFFSLGLNKHTDVPLDKIPEDLSPWDKEEAAKNKKLRDQKKQLLSLISKNEYHLFTRRKRIKADVKTWEDVIDKWDAQLEKVELGELVEIVPEPVFS